jgi:hypothetical protein
MRRSQVLLILTLVLTVSFAGYFGYQRRFQLLVKVWHWRHGYSVRLGNYDVPVPKSWAVTHQSEQSVDLIGTTGQTYGKQLPRVSIVTVNLVSRPPMSASELEGGRLKMRQFLESKGVKDIEEHSWNIDGEGAFCIGGAEYSDVQHSPSTEKIGLDCSSTGSIYLRFLGWRADLQDFYSIVSQIRKHN